MPSCGPTDVRVRVQASGVNFTDLLARVGLYPDAPPPPTVLGYEVSGTVDAVGSEVQGFKAGDPVMAATRFGGYAEYAVTHAASVMPIPRGIEVEEAASVPVAFATAYAALVRYGAVQPGERVLIHSAAGGVGSAAVQVAREAGAVVHGTASAGKHDIARALGASAVYDYHDARWRRGLPRFDLIIDPLGPRSYRRSFQMLRAGGRLVVFGASDLLAQNRRQIRHVIRSLLHPPGVSFVRQMRESKSVIGLNALALWDEHGSLGHLLRSPVELLAAGRVRPVVGRMYTLGQAPAAHQALGARLCVGKVLLTT